MSKILGKGDISSLSTSIGGDNYSATKNQTGQRSSVKRASLLYTYQGMSKEGQASEVGVENDRLKTSIDILQNQIKMKDDDFTQMQGKLQSEINLLQEENDVQKQKNRE